jgi:hypothetical protein
VIDDINISTRVEKTIKSLLIAISYQYTVTLPIEEIIGNYEIKIINNEQVKIQPNSSITNVNIT